MASYLILTPPGGPDRNQDRTRFIRDGFSFIAFLFPTLWMLFHRLWLQAAAAFLLQILGMALISRNGFLAAGIAVILGVRLLAALEGRQAFAANLLSRGWRPEGLVAAADLRTAEEIYFSGIEPRAEEDIHATRWDIPARRGNIAPGGPAFGLPGYDGGH